MQELQLVVVSSTLAIALLSFILALFLTLKFKETGAASYLFWSLGMWFFTLGVVLEVLFAIGIYSQSIAALYLFVVSFTVELLALGSMQLVHSRPARIAYYSYCGFTTLILLFYLFNSKIGNIIVTYVVFGSLPLPVVAASSAITFPAAVLIALIAAISYVRSKSKKMLSIILGVVIVSMAGTLYIASMPEFLYLSEFAGIFLLWFGFFDFDAVSKNRRQSKRG
ncbi:MAG: hypothetical protein ACP5UC_00475 [Candidatus Micrarchaeia archaeon]